MSTKYYLVTQKWRSGFVSQSTTIEYLLKQELKMCNSLSSIEETTYQEIAEEEYKKFRWGDEPQPVKTRKISPKVSGKVPKTIPVTKEKENKKTPRLSTLEDFFTNTDKPKRKRK
jgi:hypothetical protein